MKKTITKVLSVALVLALCLPMALAFSATTSAEPLYNGPVADRDQDGDGATFLYFDKYDAATGKITSNGKEIAITGTGWGNFCNVAAADDGYGIKLTKGANDINQYILYLNDGFKGYSDYFLSNDGRYYVVRFKADITTSSLSIRMNSSQGHNDCAVDVTGDWQTVIYPCAGWGFANGTNDSNWHDLSVQFNGDFDGTVYVDFFGIVWGDDYEAKANAEAEKQAAFHEALAEEDVAPVNTERNLSGFIYFDNVVGNTSFTSQGVTCSINKGNPQGNVVSATEDGYGIKLTNAGFGGQTMFDFTHATGIYTETSAQLAIRFKVVNAPNATMGVVIRNTSHGVQTNTNFTPTGDWQTVVMTANRYTLWHSNPNIRVNFTHDTANPGNMEIYIDWIASAWTPNAAFNDVLAKAEARSADLWTLMGGRDVPTFSRPSAQYASFDGVTVDTRRLAYFDNYSAGSFSQGTVTNGTATGSVFGNYGIALAPGQTRLEWTSKIAMIHGATTFVRYKVINADPNATGGDMYLTNYNNGSKGIHWTVGAPTGDWEWVVNNTYTNSGNYLNVNERAQLQFPNFGENAIIFVDVAGTIVKTADANEDGVDDAFAAFKAAMDANWAKVDAYSAPYFLGVQQNANNDIRFIAARKEWKAVEKCGFDVVIKDASGTVIGSNAESANKESNRAYASIVAAGETTTAGDLCAVYTGAYMFTYSLKNVPTTGTYVLEVTPYSIWRSAKQCGHTFTVTVVDGVVSVAY